jgi:hypothetical protein
MPDDEFERFFQRIIPEFKPVARRFWDAAEETQRERLRAFLDSPSQEAPIRDQTRRKPRVRSRKSYGSVSVPVTLALAELSADSPNGVTVADLEAHFELHGGGPTGKQIRAALKQLTKSEKAVNVSRGKYLSPSASESRGAGKPGDDAPGSFNLAAE